MLDLESKINLINHRLEMSEEKLESSRLLLEAKNYRDSISRSYYSIFSAIRAVLAFNGTDFRKHSAIISAFRKEYIKTGIFDNKYSNIIGAAFDARSKSDYDEFFIFFKSDAEEQYNNAKEFLEAVKSYLDNRIKEENKSE